MEGSFAQRGMSPPFSMAISRCSLSARVLIAATCCEGAILYLGSIRGNSVKPKISASIWGVSIRVKRPHTGLLRDKYITQEGLGTRVHSRALGFTRAGYVHDFDI